MHLLSWEHFNSKHAKKVGLLSRSMRCLTRQGVVTTQTSSQLLLTVATILFKTMTYDEQIEQVRNSLNYLIAEGVVIETSPGMYRLKTDKELKQELDDISNL